MPSIVLPGRTIAEALATAGIRLLPPPGLAQRHAIEPIQLSERENQIMALVIAGLTDREISARLHLDRRWITRTVTNLVRRTDSTSKLACAVRLTRAGKIH